MSKRISILFFLFTLIGCSAAKENAIVCEKKTPLIEVKIELHTQNEQILSSEMVLISDYSDVLIEEQKSVEDLESLLAQSKTNYNALKGVSFDYTRHGSLVTEYLTVDYESSNLEVLSSQGLVGDVEYGYVSIDTTVTNYENAGYTCWSHNGS